MPNPLYSPKFGTVEGGAAKLLGVAEKTLRAWRTTGGGPRFLKVGPGRGARVRYCHTDLERWLDAKTREHTAGEG